MGMDILLVRICHKSMLINLGAQVRGVQQLFYFLLVDIFYFDVFILRFFFNAGHTRCPSGSLTGALTMRMNLSAQVRGDSAIVSIFIGGHFILVRLWKSNWCASAGQPWRPSAWGYSNFLKF